MNGSTESRAWEAFERSGAPRVTFSWARARHMLPLVRHIVAEVVVCREDLHRMHPEKADLDDRRRRLGWPQRSRRYQLQEDITTTERRLAAALEELKGLGVVILDPATGEVGFPTMIAKRRSLFSWLPGEEDLGHCYVADDPQRHPIPAMYKRSEARRQA